MKHSNNLFILRSFKYLNVCDLVLLTNPIAANDLIQREIKLSRNIMHRKLFQFKVTAVKSCFEDEGTDEITLIYSSILMTWYGINYWLLRKYQVYFIQCKNFSRVKIEKLLYIIIC